MYMLFSEYLNIVVQLIIKELDFALLGKEIRLYDADPVSSTLMLCI